MGYGDRSVEDLSSGLSGLIGDLTHKTQLAQFSMLDPTEPSVTLKNKGKSIYIRDLSFLK